jgi:hypothetical protein
MRSLYTLLAVLAASPAMALPFDLRWQNPPTWTDGTALDPADIIQHQVQWTGACPDFRWLSPANDHVVSGNGTSIRLDVSPGSERCFRVRVAARYRDCTVTELETCIRQSEWAGLTSPIPPLAPVEPVPAKVPGAPTGLVLEPAN